MALALIACAVGLGVGCGPRTEPEKSPDDSAPEATAAEEVLEIRFCGRDGVNIRTGPGINYRKDRKGRLKLGETLYILERKGDWIRFRNTPEHTGWSGWVREDFTLSGAEYEQRHDELWEAFDRSQGIR